MDFAPAVYEHAAALIGRSPWEVSRDEDLLVAAHTEAFRRYRHVPVIVGIDVYNLEPEAYGALIPAPQGNTLPTITPFPCAGAAEIPGLPLPDPAKDGRLPLILSAGRRLRQQCPEADVRIPASGPFSIAAHLVGLDTLLCEVLTDPDAVRAALFHIVEGQRRFMHAIHDSGLLATSFESAATPPLLSPALFRSVLLPALAAFIRNGTEALGTPLPLIIGGNTSPVIADILETGTRYVICPSETDQTAFMNAMAAHPDVTVRINMNPGVFSTGRWNGIAAEITRVLALAGTRPNTCIGTGVLPFEADPALVRRAGEFVASRSSFTSTPKDPS